MISLTCLNEIARWSHALTLEEAERARRGIVEKTYARGSYIFHRGDRFDCWAGVVTGLLKISIDSASGKTVTLAGLPAGTWFGEGSVLKAEARRYDLVALRETRLALMDGSTFSWLFENSAAFNRFLVRQFNERLGQFIGQVENDRMLDATARLARTLAFLFNPELHPAVGRHLALTQEEIGLLGGLSRQATNKALKVLEAAGVLTLERGGVLVPDWGALNRYGVERAD